MSQYFGTDGIRGIANNDLTIELSSRVGNALTILKGRPLVVIGTDTRTSKDMIKSAVMSGILAGGGNVIDLGVLTTPAISYITTLYKADFGVVISASHNPPEYNGIKIFDNLGAKLGEAERDFIEDCINKNKTNYSQDFGTMEDDLISHERYINFLADSVDTDLSGLKVVLDCSNGASFEVAPKLFQKLGAQVFCYNCNHTGHDINVNCGSLHEEFLSKKTQEHKADIGFAFDGDADRVIASDCDGQIINGDSIIYILAKYLHSVGRLKGDMVVGTHHTNMGMEMALKECGIKLIRADIGDHFVACEMDKYNCLLGGEQSGHIILKNFAPTGDGILAALQLVSVLKKTKKSIRELNDFFVYPQENINIQVSDKHKVLADKFLQSELIRIGKEIANKGRLLVRASGTEPKVRIMTECIEQKLTKEIANQIAEIVKKVSAGV